MKKEDFMTDTLFHLFENDFYGAFPEIFFAFAILLLLFFGVSFPQKSMDQNAFSPSDCLLACSWLGLLSLVFTLILIQHNPIHHSVFFSNCFIIDDMTTAFKSLLCASSAGVLLLSLSYFQQEKILSFEVVLFMLFSTFSMMVMISSYDFLSLYLSLEFQTLCFYVLAASKRNSEFSTEAGLKYFLLGAFSSGIFLFGCSLVYGFTGMTNFADLALLFTGTGDPSMLSTSEGLSNHGIILGILFVGVGFLFKLTAAPFHMWAPDVYEGSPTFTTAFFAIVPKIALLAVFARLFLFSFYDLHGVWQNIVLLCSFASLCVGAFAALSQQKIKRLLAYSSIGHVGYILLGFSCASLEGVEAVFLYLVIYVIMNINVFGILLSCMELPMNSSGSQMDTRSDQHRLKYISDLGMLARTNPLLAGTFACTMFSLAGIPPTAGFCSKFYVFFAALGSGFYFFAFVGVLTSVISCFYYIRCIKIMYFEKPSHWAVYPPMSKEKSLLIGMTFFFIVFFFVYPSPLFLLAHKVALSLV